MNPYQVCINVLGLTADHQWELGWAFALFSVGATLDLSTSGNPYQAVIDDLRSRHVSPHVIRRVRQLFNTEYTKYEAR